jgi:hypothetical protein
MTKQVWTRSTREEVISALWLIAALLASIRGYSMLAVVLSIKALFDTVASVVLAVVDRKK